MPHDAKAALRARMQEDLRAIDPAQRAQWSLAIASHIVDSIIPESARVIMLYLAQDTELDMDPLIERLLASDRTVAIPEVEEAGSGMRPIRLDTLSPSALDVDRFGIRVPHQRDPIAPDDLDVVVVPGVAFTPTGARLGRGGGFYDRFLKSLPEATMRVGACFRMQLLEEIPALPHDHPMGVVVTEEGVHSARN